MAKLESGFSAEIRKDLRNLYGEDIFEYLVPDMRRTGKKPFDFFLLYNGKFCAIECKFSKGRSFNFYNDIQPHQPGFLARIRKVKCNAFFLLGFHKYMTALLFREDDLDYLSNLSTKGSLKYEAFLHEGKYFVEAIIPRRKIDGVTRWEVEKIIECLH